MIPVDEILIKVKSGEVLREHEPSSKCDKVYTVEINETLYSVAYCNDGGIRITDISNPETFTRNGKTYVCGYPNGVFLI